MSDPYLVKPDREFLDRILGEGGEDLKQCMQCATCSVVCELSDKQRPFPRKEMIWAQWGLKDRLMSDRDVWVCHQCNDCSTQCPRGARPGDVLAVVRHQFVEHYAVPKFLGRLLNQNKTLAILLLAPILVLLLALGARGTIEGIGPLQGILHFLDHDPPAFYASFFPHWMLIGVFTTFTCLAALGMLVSVVRFWMAMKAADEASGGSTPALGIIPSAISTLVSIVTHDEFVKCGDKSSRRLTHLGAFYGFLALFVVTVWAVLDLYLMPMVSSSFPMYPFHLAHPMKILANVGCVLLIFGCVRVVIDRMNKQEDSVRSTTFDWVFIWLLLGVAVSGLLTEILRFVADGGHGAELTAMGYVAYAIYFVHLVLVFDLLVYLPYSKFAHIVYRTVALVYAKHAGRNGKPLAASQ